MQRCDGRCGWAFRVCLQITTAFAPTSMFASSFVLSEWWCNCTCRLMGSNPFSVSIFASPFNNVKLDTKIDVGANADVKCKQTIRSYIAHAHVVPPPSCPNNTNVYHFENFQWPFHLYYSHNLQRSIYFIINSYSGFCRGDPDSNLDSKLMVLWIVLWIQ